jgi:hypothetical protein
MSLIPQSPTNYMAPQPNATQTHLKNLATCLTITADTLETLAGNLKIPLLEPICNTTQSLSKFLEVNCLKLCRELPSLPM